MAGTATWRDAVAPDKLVEQAWPVLLGLALVMVLRRVERRVPAIPEGDLVVLGERLVASVPALHHPVLGIEAGLRRWPVAGLALLLLMVVLGAAILGAAAPT